MLIAVVSDTHMDGYSMKKVLKKIKSADMLIHLGDNVSDAKWFEKNFGNRVVYVRGNCDYSPSEPAEIIEEICGKRIFITHGHHYGVKYGIEELQSKAEAENANIALYGHTHRSAVDYIRGIWYINPGSAAMARDASESFAMIEIKDGKVNPWLVVV
ncbi:metallophosphoesterase [Clostridium oryzae]|uniref:Phosphoesterase n=1 Tax=Clostridium oryzae TaxID=1450648 RepID=A0A1V4IWG6_9CLOT|nr:metallophosphoesterase [Clostridium oryzae]OPJ64170.1 hypothetical protein CLORY_07350 [Clostridium oryzae]